MSYGSHLNPSSSHESLLPDNSTAQGSNEEPVPLIVKRLFDDVRGLPDRFSRTKPAGGGASGSSLVWYLRDRVVLRISFGGVEVGIQPGRSSVQSVAKARKQGGATVDVKDIVSRDPEVVSGTLVFKGTRVPVEVLVQHLAEGDSLEDFLDGFPSVSREQAVAYLEMTPEAVDALVAR
jgi:uncharacterized protein (DUF433 family)